ncbi:hypothetical protein BDA99DRAFT_223835 [Phascolomyces articulosus]|uniref:Uncharacterized protein n=1 Tax=Phascolomyces articulosus TaxID=60185 RepID=A0AAD5K0E1_9FUNG|nr:hypothetical protein BDA99DRAFT_223835 [Phascolomyces articulosus]
MLGLVQGYMYISCLLSVVTIIVIMDPLLWKSVASISYHMIKKIWKVFQKKKSKLNYYLDIAPTYRSHIKVLHMYIINDIPCFLIIHNYVQCTS